MAVNLPSNLYSGGAVTFNTQPSLAFAEQLMLRRQAREQAMDQYQQQLNQQVNMQSNGMRPQDMGALYKNEAQVRNFYVQNRDKILNPRLDHGEAQAQYQGLQSRSYGIISQSKGAAEKEKFLYPILQDPDKRDLMSDNDHQNIMLHELPIDDPRHRDFDIGSLDFKPKPWDSSKFQTELAQAFPMSKDAAGVTKGADGTLIENFLHQRSPEDYPKMYSYVVNQYHSNRTMQKNLDDQYKNGVNMDQLNPWFKQTFGHDIKTPEDYAVASQIMPLQSQRTEAQYRPNSYENMITRMSLSLQNRLAEIAKTQGYINQRAQDKQNRHDQVVSTASDYGDWLEAQAKQDGGLVYSHNGGSSETHYPIKSQLPLQAFTLYDPTLKRNVHPDEASYLDNGNVRLIVYKKDENGQVQTANGKKLINPDLTHDVSNVDFKAALAKQIEYNPTIAKSIQSSLKAETGGGGATTAPTTTAKGTTTQSPAPAATVPAFSRQELLNSGRGWTNEKIDDFVRRGKLKIKE